MNSPSNQQTAATEDPLARAMGRAQDLVQGVEGEEVARRVHPQEQGREVVPSGNFPVKAAAEIPAPRPAPAPVRASAMRDDSEIISGVPGAAGKKRRQLRNRKAASPLKMLAMFAAAQLVLGVLFFLLFGGMIRGWLQDSAVAPDGVTAKEAAELRGEVRAAESGFQQFGADLERVKKQIALKPGDAWAELEILGQRNELTLLADDAITNGNRLAYDQLLAASKQLEGDKRLVDGATAEILRVKTFYGSGTRLGSYALPVATLYPSLKTAKEQELSSSQLIRLLGDKDKDWRVRTRAAYLLGSRRNMAVAEALVDAAKRDPNLDVVKECIATFEENTGYRAKTLFDIEALENWWRAYETRVGLRASQPQDPS